MTSQYGVYELHGWISKATHTYAHAYAHTPGHLHARTHRQLYNTYCFSTATLVSRTRLSVTSYVHNLSSFYCTSFREVSRVTHSQAPPLMHELENRDVKQKGFTYKYADSCVFWTGYFIINLKRWQEVFQKKKILQKLHIFFSYCPLSFTIFSKTLEIIIYRRTKILPVLLFFEKIM